MNKENSASPATTEQWRELYALAAAIKKLAPWKVLWDTDIVTLHLPDGEEPLFFSILGRNEECYGLVLYPDYDALLRLYRLIHADEDEPSLLYAFEQNALTCYFGDRDEIEPEDRAVLQALGLKFRGHNQWIFFRNMSPGEVPWFMTGEQVALLTLTFRQLLPALEDYLSGAVTVNFEANETLLRHCDETGSFCTTAAPMPAIPIPIVSLQVRDELLPLRLKKQPILDLELELDSFFIPTPIQDDPDSRPRFPRLAALINRQDGMLLDQYMTDDPDALSDALLNPLVNFVLKHGRPSCLYLRNERFLGILGPLCEAAEIPIETAQGMPAADGFFAALLESGLF